jgi:hypothetical protein
MKSYIREILAIVALAIVCVLLFFVIKNQKEIIDRQNTIELSIVEQKQLSDQILRSKSSYLTKDQLENVLKENKVDLNPLKKDLETLKAEVKGINITVIRSVKIDDTDVVSTGQEVKPGDKVKEDTYNYLNTKQSLFINEKLADQYIPFGEVSFSAWRERPWDRKIYEREYKHIGVLSYDRDGKGYFHNKFSIKVDNKEYEIKVDNSSFYQEYPKEEWGFTPRIYAGFGVGASASLKPVIAPSVGVALFSYGKTKIDPTFVFVIPGVGYDTVSQKVNGELGLVYYNIANHLPLVSNLFVGASVLSNFGGDMSGLISLKVGL